MSVALYSMNRKILTTLKEICMYIAKQRSNPTNICSHEARMIIPSFHIIVQFAQNSTLPAWVITNTLSSYWGTAVPELRTDHDRLNRARRGAVGKLIYIKTIFKSYLQDAKKDFRDADV